MMLPSIYLKEGIQPKKIRKVEAGGVLKQYFLFIYSIA